MHLSGVERQPDGGPDLLESELPGGSGIDGQQFVDGIVHHLEDVRMPRDEEFGMQGLNLLYGARVVMAGVAADVGHQHPNPSHSNERKGG